MAFIYRESTVSNSSDLLLTVIIDLLVCLECFLMLYTVCSEYSFAIEETIIDYFSAIVSSMFDSYLEQYF